MGCGGDGGGLEDSVPVAGRARSLLCVCLFTKTHSSLMLAAAASLQPGASPSHRSGTASRAVRA